MDLAAAAAGLHDSLGSEQLGDGPGATPRGTRTAWPRDLSGAGRRCTGLGANLCLAVMGRDQDQLLSAVHVHTPPL